MEMLLGAFLAVLIAVSLGWLLWWMLHRPAPVSPEVAKARRSIDAVKRILVPTLGMAYSERGVELACRLGLEQKAEIILVYVLEVPRTIPLGTPLPEAEAKAQESLSRAQAIVKLHGLSATPRLERAREVVEGIIRVAKDFDVDLIVLGIRPRVSAAEDILGRTSDALLRRAPCEVVVTKLPG
jgi:nucleotide-binding universal stress UspA family protein